MPEPTWTAGLFGGEAGADELAEAERKVAILKAELEAIRGGRKEASASELRKLERDYRDAVAKVQQLRVTARPTPAPRPSVTPRPTGTPTPPRAGGPPLTPRSMPTPTPMPTRTPTPSRVGGPQPAPRPMPTPTPVATRTPAPPGAGLWRPPGSAVAASERLKRPSYAATDPRYGRAYIPSTGGAAGGAGGAGDYGLIDPFFAMLTPEQQQQYIAQQLGGMSEYQRQSLAQQGRMTPYQMAQLGQGQAAAGATAAYRQQQHEQQQAQLKQAWAVAQAELAHAQNVMASQIGTGVAGMQSQQWAQGLPYALPKGTTVAPGYERGGPMQQLHRMSGSQFTPGTTGRISPHPGPSQQQMMQWVQQAMGQFGAGR